MDICDEFDEEEFLKRMKVKDRIRTTNEYNWAKSAYKNGEKNLMDSAIVVASLDGVFKRNDPEEIRNWRSRIRLS